MKGWLQFRSWLVVLLVAQALFARAESHRATHLGNPATRFATPLKSPEDLRARFRDPKLQPDFAAVLHQWGWQGDINDMFMAASKAEITDSKIAVGEIMPFMSSRENGRPICLRNVTWAGQDPAPAYTFDFASKGRLYRCITPKACSNFFVTDIGPEPKHELALNCNVPETLLVGRKVKACLTVANKGNVPEREAVITMTVPGGTVALEATEGARLANSTVTWLLSDLAVGASKSFCVNFKTMHTGAVSFQTLITHGGVELARSTCETSVGGVSGLLFEKSDDPDPIAIGETTTYTVKVTNQGSAEDTNVKVEVEFPEQIDPLKASNDGELSGRWVRFPVVPRLAPKDSFEYSITAKGVKAGDARVKFTRTSTDIPTPISAEESTFVY